VENNNDQTGRLVGLLFGICFYTLITGAASLYFVKAYTSELTVFLKQNDPARLAELMEIFFRMQIIVGASVCTLSVIYFIIKKRSRATGV
jgi:hypothetical protein